jgi:hypothetical protein
MNSLSLWRARKKGCIERAVIARCYLSLRWIMYQKPFMNSSCPRSYRRTFQAQTYLWVETVYDDSIIEMCHFPKLASAYSGVYGRTHRRYDYDRSEDPIVE